MRTYVVVKGKMSHWLLGCDQWACTESGSVSYPRCQYRHFVALFWFDIRHIIDQFLRQFFNFFCNKFRVCTKPFFCMQFVTKLNIWTFGRQFNKSKSSLFVGMFPSADGRGLTYIKWASNSSIQRRIRFKRSNFSEKWSPVLSTDLWNF